MEPFSPVFQDSYDPLKAGSIDGTDEYPHDRAISRAMVAKYKCNKFVQGSPDCTIFIGRLSPHTTEDTIKSTFKQFGKISNVRLVKDIVTGFSKCYCFVEFGDAYQARAAVRMGHKIIVDDHEVLVEYEKERTLKGWIPRRLGGGLGGKRESGQLRFGGKERPFRKPLLRPDMDKGKHEAVTEKEYSTSRRRQRSRSNSRERYHDRSRENHRSTGREKYRSKDK